MLEFASWAAQVVGQTAIDRLVIAATWLGIIALATVILLGAASKPRLR